MVDDNMDTNDSTGRSNIERSDSSESDRVKENVKEKVAKGVATVAGALEGFAEEAKKRDLAGKTKEAIQKAGETTREVAGTAKKEVVRTKERLTGGQGRAMGDSMGGTSSSGGVPDLRKTELGADRDLKGATRPMSDVEDESSE